MAFQHGAGFRIAGTVCRKPFVVSSGKVAFITIEVRGERTKKLDLKAFGDQVVDVGELREGDDVEFTGTVDMEKVTDKSKNVVQKDGRDLWVPSLVIRVVKKQERPKMNASDINF